MSLLRTRYILLATSLLFPASGIPDIRLQQFDPFTTLDLDNDLLNTSQSPSISLAAAKGEFEPARIVLQVSQNWGESTAKISALKSTNKNTIPSSAFEIRNVQRWQQLIPHAYKKGNKPPFHVVDELLVFDDTIPLSGNWDTGKYIPPLVSGKFKTVLTAGMSKQLWLTIRIPEDQPAGLYRGRLVLSADNQQAIVPVSVNVLPFSLPKPDKHFGIFFRGSLANNKRHISKEDLHAQLLDIKLHGFNTLVINEHDLNFLPSFIRTYKQIGFEGPIVLSIPKFLTEDSKYLDSVILLLQAEGIDHYIYGIDEPNTPKIIEKQIAFQSSLASDSPVFTSLLSVTDDLLLRRGVTLDWANLNVKSGTDNLNAKSSRKNRIITYYWQSYLEDAPRNRYYTGAFLLKTGLDGVYPYVYQAFHSIDPYMTDIRQLGGSRLRNRRLYKAFNTTYPAFRSSIPTIQWESMREGIDDYRYAQLLLSLARSQSSESLNQVTKQMSTRISKINYSESSNFEVNTEFDASSLSNLRSWMIDQILELLEKPTE